MSIQRLSNAGQSGYRYKSLIAGITPVASVPVIGEATAVTFSTASVTFTAPGAYAGSTYTATSSPGGLTGTSASSPITVSGLSGDTAYTFTVTATNATGTSGPSAASNSITTPTEFVPESGYDALATVTVPSGGLASVVFTSIPTGYKHLQIRMLSISNGSAINGGAMYFNGDTSASNYYSQYIIGNGSSITVGANQDTYTPFTVGVAASPSVGIVDILDYASTTKTKVSRELNGFDANGSGRVNYNSTMWNSTSAITQIALNFSAFQQNTQFALYGVK